MSKIWQDLTKLSIYELYTRQLYYAKLRKLSYIMSIRALIIIDKAT